ncbi:CNNM domain-containing protein [Oxalobacter aliiformigenes]|uniref:CNNM domain-containing protein n=1 Tax=Oxalobacter aliiformigenes TaxID=2946593 RepID=UPI0022AF4E9E|nr:CNNM domain-containing protein [Oxalobacter aliiformigenes]
MSAFLTDLLLLVLLTLLNGIFTMSEIALVSSRKVRLQSLSDEGSSGARKALELYRFPPVFCRLFRSVSLLSVS